MIVAALLLALFQGGSPIVRFDSRKQGRTFSVDPGKLEIRQALRDARHGDDGSLRAFVGTPTVGSRGFSSVDRVLSKRKDHHGKRALPSADNPQMSPTCGATRSNWSRRHPSPTSPPSIRK